MSFFFSSRRRHTRFDCDWSSDVCSSDLPGEGPTNLDAARHFIGVADELDGELHGTEADYVLSAATVQEELQKRSEEHTSELQSQSKLVCRLLLEKKKNKNISISQAARLS